MSAVITLTLKQPPALRVDMRGITPSALAELSAADIERLSVTHGIQTVVLADLFRVSRSDSLSPEGRGSDEPLPCRAHSGLQAGIAARARGMPLESPASPPTLSPEGRGSLHFVGDLSRFDRVGWQMNGGLLRVEGHVGDYAGGCMSAGEMHVAGNAGALAACEMAGGSLTIAGDVGDFAATTLPGSMDGMRGGTFVVRGNAGARFGDRMRRGTALVFGDAGDFLASRMVAGTIAIGGSAGRHVGYGMRRGSVVFAGANLAIDISNTFVPAIADAKVFWQLLSRDLARHGGPFADLPARTIRRHLGDVAAGGKGELIATL